MKMTMEVNRRYAFVRIGQREVHIERHPEGYCSSMRSGDEGWVSVKRQVFGRDGWGGRETIWYVGRLSVHFVRHYKAQADRVAI